MSQRSRTCSVRIAQNVVESLSRPKAEIGGGRAGNALSGAYEC